MDSVDRVVELDSVGKSSDVKHPPQDKELGQTTSVSVGEDLAMQRRLSTFKAENRWDPNLEDPNDTFADIDDTLHDHNVEGEHALVDRLLENSPYPEVRQLDKTINQVQNSDLLRPGPCSCAELRC